MCCGFDIMVWAISLGDDERAMIESIYIRIWLPCHCLATIPFCRSPAFTVCVCVVCWVDSVWLVDFCDERWDVVPDVCLDLLLFFWLDDVTWKEASWLTVGCYLILLWLGMSTIRTRPLTSWKFKGMKAHRIVPLLRYRVDVPPISNLRVVPQLSLSRMSRTRGSTNP